MRAIGVDMPQTVGGVIAKTVCGYNADETAAMVHLKDLYQRLTADAVIREIEAGKKIGCCSSPRI